VSLFTTLAPNPSIERRNSQMRVRLDRWRNQFNLSANALMESKHRRYSIQEPSWSHRSSSPNGRRMVT
jgi:hypothetical protein